MSVLGSLPNRPLTDAELASFNRSDALDVAVDVADLENPDEGEVIGLLLATENWVKGLAYGDDGWRVVETSRLDDGENERYDGMRTCERAVREALE